MISCRNHNLKNLHATLIALLCSFSVPVAAFTAFIPQKSVLAKLRSMEYDKPFGSLTCIPASAHCRGNHSNQSNHFYHTQPHTLPPAHQHTHTHTQTRAWLCIRLDCGRIADPLRPYKQHSSRASGVLKTD